MSGSYPSDLVPYRDDDDAACAREAILALLTRRGPTSKEAIECWFHERASLVIDIAALYLFETGKVDYSWEDDQRQTVLLQRIEEAPEASPREKRPTTADHE